MKNKNPLKVFGNIKHWWIMKRWVDIKPSTLLFLFIAVFLTFVFAPFKTYQYYQSQKPQYAEVLDKWKSCNEYKHRMYCKYIVKLNYENEVNYIWYYDHTIKYSSFKIGETYNFRHPFRYISYAGVSEGYISRPFIVNVLDTLFSIMIMILIVAMIASPVINESCSTDLRKYLKKKARYS